MRDEAFDAANQLTHRAERTTLDGALGNEPEPALDLIEPRGIGGREVQVKPRMPDQPSFHLRVLGHGVVVEDAMNVEPRGDVGVDVREEAEELLVAMPRLALVRTSPLWMSRAANSVVVPCRM